MPGNTAILTVKILADAKQATGEVDKAASKFGAVGKGIRAAAIPAGLLGGALLVGAKKAVDAASRTQQAFGGLDAVFGKSGAKMKTWAAGAADSVGLAKAEYGELATLIGSQLKNAGVPADQLAGKTNDLIKTGADLAAMYGGTTAQAVEALSSALKGEMDPMEKYGTSLNQNAIKAQMMADGTDKLTGKQATAAKSAATLALITKQTADAHGAAAREYDSAAAAQQRLSAKTENLMSDMGTVLLPVVSKLADMMGKVAGFATRNTGAFQILVGVIAGFVVVILALNAAMSAYNTISAASTAIQGALKGSLIATRIQLAALAVWEKIVAVSSWLMQVGFKAAWRALLGPVGLVIAAIALVVAGFVLLYKKSATFRRIVDATWAAVKRGAQVAAAIVKRVWAVVWAALSAYVRTYVAVVRVVFNVIRAIARSVASVVRAVWRVVWAAISAYARTYVAVVRSVFNAIRSAVSSVVNSIRSAFKNVWSSVTSAARAAAGALKSPFESLHSAISKVISAVESLIGWLGRIHVPKISLPHIGGKSSKGVASSALTPGFRAAGGTSSTTRAAAPGGIVINVTGAVDPESVARQISRILQGHERRIGLRAT